MMLSWIKMKAKTYWPSSMNVPNSDQPDERDSTKAESAPWDIGRPQPAIVSLANDREIHGTVLDVGCGTGENALYLAGLGYDVTGIDSSRAAIEASREKARQRNARVNFRLVDALDLACLGTTFNTVIDSGLFHLFTDLERPRFVSSLAAVLQPGGNYFMLCFSDQETREGPRRVSQAELRASFQQGWTINRIQGATFETNIHQGGAKAWLAFITRSTTNDGAQV